jgi:ribosomal-protein-serine acetyltransferase
VTTPFPETIEGDRLALRGWRPADAEDLHALVEANRGHLRPWMAWASEPVTVEQYRELLAGWQASRAAGVEAVYGMFIDGDAVGGCGLHPRLGPAGLEIGYWVAEAWTRRGVATEAARALTTVALARAGVDHVEIHHDRGNEASGGVPAGLGFTFIGEVAREPQAPAEVGRQCVWRITAGAWPPAHARTGPAGAAQADAAPR